MIKLNQVMVEVNLYVGWLSIWHLTFTSALFLLAEKNSLNPLTMSILVVVEMTYHRGKVTFHSYEPM